MPKKKKTTNPNIIVLFGLTVILALVIVISALVPISENLKTNIPPSGEQTMCTCSCITGPHPGTPGGSSTVTPPYLYPPSPYINPTTSTLVSIPLEDRLDDLTYDPTYFPTYNPPPPPEEYYMGLCTEPYDEDGLCPSYNTLSSAYSSDCTDISRIECTGSSWDNETTTGFTYCEPLLPTEEPTSTPLDEAEELVSTPLSTPLDEV